MSEHDSTRTSGVDFGSFEDALTSIDYPITTADLVDRFGDHELEHANGTVSVGDVLGATDTTFESPGEVRRAVVGGMDMDAVGRKRYTDRGGATPEERDRGPEESL